MTPSHSAQRRIDAVRDLIEEAVRDLIEENARLKAEFAAYRAAVDAYVARNVWQTLRPDRAWQSMETGCSIYRTRADAEAAFRRATQLPEATPET